jgi:hypothetical protein
MDWVQRDDASSWLSAVGTIAAVAVALGLAIADGLRRSREERRRQAELITAWVAEEGDPRPWVWVTLANASIQVAYRFVISIVSIVDGSPVPRPPGPRAWRRFVSQLPPGERKPFSVDWPVAVGTARPRVEIAFQDAAGGHWIRDINGKLKEVKNTDHLKPLGLEEPLDWDFEGPAGDLWVLFAFPALFFEHLLTNSASRRLAARDRGQQ